MKIAILTQNPTGHSVERLRATCAARGHQARVMTPNHFTISLSRERPELFYKSGRLRLPDAVIPRIGASITFFGTAVVRQFEQMGVFTLNTAHSIANSRDKLRALQVLSAHNIGITATQFVRGPEAVLEAIERVGGAPVIIKVIEGSQGVGVILAETIQSAQAIVETLQGVQQNVLIQKFVEESKGRDIRALVVGGRVIAAMRRRAVGGEYRSNVHRGGTTEAVSLDPEFEATAIRAAQILGLRVAGVDLLESKEGPQVMEVNSSPGLKGIEAATGVDVASAIVQHLEDQVQFPEIDIKQRLTPTSDYGVAEIRVKRGSRIVGLSVAEAVGEEEVRILNIVRKKGNVQMPRGRERLQAGDRLLCYGKLGALKEIKNQEEVVRRASVVPSGSAGSVAVEERELSGSGGNSQV